MQLFTGFLNGFSFTIGCAAAFVIIYLALRAILKRKNKKSVNTTVKVWKDYLKLVLISENFTEAAFVRKLIDGKNDAQYVETPAGYKVEVDKDISFEDGKIKANKEYKIIKLSDAD